MWYVCIAYAIGFWIAYTLIAMQIFGVVSAPGGRIVDVPAGPANIYGHTQTNVQIGLTNRPKGKNTMEN